MANPKFSNDLTDAMLERLAILSEEMGEAQQAVGKIIRHGYHGWNPEVVGTGTNRDDLAKELGDILCAMEMLCDSGDVEESDMVRRVRAKHEKIKPYLHHQTAEATK